MKLSRKSKPTLSQLSAWAKSIKEINKENEELARRQSPSLYNSLNIDLFKTESYDTTQLNCWSFRKSEDVREGVQISLGNMCKGFPFTVQGHLFHNLESAFISGMFSHESQAHSEVQQLLKEESNGYSAKKCIRRRNESLKRTDWEEFNVQWMFYVVWQKCLANKDFRNLLTKHIPANAVIVENSTRQKGSTATFWGAKNKELEDCRDVVEAYLEQTHTTILKKDLNRLKMTERNEINNIGTFTGVNCMGKILKLCQISLLNNTVPPIDCTLLESKDIYLLGRRVEFIL